MRKKFLTIVVSLALILISITIYDFFHAVESVRVEPVDLTYLAAKETLSQEDYALIFQQTGLGQVAVDELKENAEDFASELLRFQKQIQENHSYEQTFMFFPTTTAELLTDEQQRERSLILPPLQTGDILITKSTKTLLYRHGHAAVITDAERGVAVEAMMLGSPSMTTSLHAWRSYATLMILRPKADEKCIEQATTFATKQLVDVPYNLLCGVIKKDKSSMETIDSTHCSHLVWQAYQFAGVDLDSDGGWLVTPRDISVSKELALVFSYGFGEKAAW